MQSFLVIQSRMQFEEREGGAGGGGNDSDRRATSQASNLFLFHFT